MGKFKVYVIQLAIVVVGYWIGNQLTKAIDKQMAKSSTPSA